MVTRPRLTLAGGGLTLSLDSYLDPTAASGLTALEGLAGFGLPGTSVRWFEGAGDGSSYRGARLQPREIPLPLLISGPDRLSVRDRFSELATVLSPEFAPATLTFTEPDLTAWSVAVVRTGGGDFAWGLDTDGSTFLRTSITLTAGDPYWTREAASVQIVRSGGAGRGLLKGTTPLSALRLASGQVIGDVLIENPGDAPAYPQIVVHGPGTHLTLTSPAGETLSWRGTLIEGETRTFDHRTGTVVDQDGTNRYAELDPAPRFWAVAPGTRTVGVALEGSSLASSVVVSWRPRRWLVF